MATLSLLANLGSIVGLFATCWAAWKAYQSKKYYLLVGRVPNYIELLREAASDLAHANTSSPVRTEILLALGEIRISLESIARNLGKKRRGEYLRLAAEINAIKGQKTIDSEALNKIYTEAVVLAVKAEQFVKDTKFQYR